MSNYRVYIKSLNGRPIDDWGFIAYLGFSKRQMDIIFYEDIEEVPVRTTNILVAPIDETKIYLTKLGIEIPKPLNIPDELNNYSYLHRSTQYMTMAEFKKGTKLPIFIKPEGIVKEFVAGVITKESSRRDFFNDVPDSSKVLVSEVIDIVSEWRAFVIEGEIQAISNYSGIFDVFPNKIIVGRMVKAYTNSPAGYSLDVGVTKDGETVLIECNDGWSLGSYGCETTIYARLLLKRWLELTKKN